MRVSLLSLSVLVALSSTAFAADPPGLFTHQGVLSDSAGLPLVGDHQVIFSLYDANASGNQLWSETQTVSFTDGLFAVTLGSSSLLDDATIDYDEVWVGIAVDGNPELTRVRLTSVPYALKATTATNVDGGTVNATSIQINGTTVIDSSGNVVAPVDGDNLSNLNCTDGEVAVYNGTAWECGVLGGAHQHSANDITSDTLSIDRLPMGTGSTSVAFGDHSHSLDGLTGKLLSSQLPTDFDSQVSTVVSANLGSALGTLDDANPAYHNRYADAEAVGAMGTKGAGNPLNHDRYTDANARSAVSSNLAGALGTKADGNAAFHDRYTDAEAKSAMGAAGNGNTFNHDRYTDAEAKSAMGTKGDANALNHDKYTDAEALAASSDLGALFAAAGLARTTTNSSGSITSGNNKGPWLLVGGNAVSGNTGNALCAALGLNAVGKMWNDIGGNRYWTNTSAGCEDTNGVTEWSFDCIVMCAAPE